MKQNTVLVSILLSDFCMFRFNPSISTTRKSTMENTEKEYTIKDKVQENIVPEN